MAVQRRPHGDGLRAHRLPARGGRCLLHHAPDLTRETDRSRAADHPATGRAAERNVTAGRLWWRWRDATADAGHEPRTVALRRAALANRAKKDVTEKA